MVKRWRDWLARREPSGYAGEPGAPGRPGVGDRGAAGERLGGGPGGPGGGAGALLRVAIYTTLALVGLAVVIWAGALAHWYFATERPFEETAPRWSNILAVPLPVEPPLSPLPVLSVASAIRVPGLLRSIYLWPTDEGWAVPIMRDGHPVLLIVDSAVSTVVRTVALPDEVGEVGLIEGGRIWAHGSAQAPDTFWNQAILALDLATGSVIERHLLSSRTISAWRAIRLANGRVVFIWVQPGPLVATNTPLPIITLAARDPNGTWTDERQLPPPFGYNGTLLMPFEHPDGSLWTLVTLDSMLRIEYRKIDPATLTELRHDTLVWQVPNGEDPRIAQCGEWAQPRCIVDAGRVFALWPNFHGRYYAEDLLRGLPVGRPALVEILQEPPPNVGRPSGSVALLAEVPEDIVRFGRLGLTVGADGAVYLGYCPILGLQASDDPAFGGSKADLSSVEGYYRVQDHATTVRVRAWVNGVLTNAVELGQSVRLVASSEVLWAHAEREPVYAVQGPDGTVTVSRLAVSEGQP